MTGDQWEMLRQLHKATMTVGSPHKRFVRQYYAPKYSEVEMVTLTERQSVYLLWLHHRYRKQTRHTCTDKCETLEQQLNEAPVTRKGKVKEIPHRPTRQDKEMKRLEAWQKAAQDWQKVAP